MNVLVLIAGVLDPKWPVEARNGELPNRTADRLILSPFDEAALETALSVRDAAPGTTLRAIVMGGSEAERIARSVASFNLPVALLEIMHWWDQNLVAEALSSVSGDADLILIGREFGDCDCGVVPSLIAAKLERPLFAWAQAIQDEKLMRESASAEERVKLGAGLVVSVTNDRRNRLRKPLMKNVMMARQAKIERLPARSIASRAGLAAARHVAAYRSQVECKLIDGPPEIQAWSLAEILA